MYKCGKNHVEMEIDKIRPILVEEIQKITGDKEWRYEYDEYYEDELSDIFRCLILGVSDDFDFDGYFSIDANNIHPELDRNMLKWAIKETLVRLGYYYDDIAPFIKSERIASQPTRKAMTAFFMDKYYPK